jgi:CPA2 family monovalent cation:H+ antiporter-2
MLGLSAALGSFIAGMIVATARETEWFHHALEPLRVVFVALLFVSIGMLIDPGFVVKNVFQVVLLVVGVLLTNTFINAGILRALGDDWRTSLYSGAMLAQIGEFSFILISVGLQATLVSQYGYQMTIAVISLSLVLSPIWISGMKRLTKIQKAA